MSVVLQVSDTHFGTERADVMTALQCLSASLRPDLLLLTGDITQRATASQFAAARSFVERLQVPATLAIPGNHDIPLFDLGARLFRPYQRYARAFGDVLEAEFETDTLLLLTLNTTRWYRHKNGEVSPAQIERVAHRFEHARPGQWRVVAVHQPVAVIRASDRSNLLLGHECAVRRWARAGADLIVGGHIHLPFIVPLQERWPGLPRPMWAVQAGTALSSRVRPGAGNSVNVIRAGRPGCRVERWDHDRAAGSFALVNAIELTADRAEPGGGTSAPVPRW